DRVSAARCTISATHPETPRRKACPPSGYRARSHIWAFFCWSFSSTVTCVVAELFSTQSLCVNGSPARNLRSGMLTSQREPCIMTAYEREISPLPRRHHHDRRVCPNSRETGSQKSLDRASNS